MPTTPYVEFDPNTVELHINGTCALTGESGPVSDGHVVTDHKIVASLFKVERMIAYHAIAVIGEVYYAVVYW